MDSATWTAALLIGIGATFTIDLWAQLLKRAFQVPSLNLCLLGRWVLHMPGGTLVHPDIRTASPRRYECTVGWTSHYLIGVGFATGFLLLAGPAWLARPTLFPALLFGAATVVVPLLTMQPAFGLGIASSRTPHPWKARLKSLMTHTVFGAGLYLWAQAWGFAFSF